MSHFVNDAQAPDDSGSQSRSTSETIKKFYHPETQMSVGQVSVIASAIASAGPAANVLVFGCGNDSTLWYHLNWQGNTLFVEDNIKWAQIVRERSPYLQIEIVSFEGRTVADSFPIVEADLKRVSMPQFLQSKAWNVIIVDAPAGNLPKKPGRSLSIYWASVLSKPTTHIFVDDYTRRLEREYANHFFANRSWKAVVPRVRRLGRPNGGAMLWVIGAPDVNVGGTSI